MSAFSSVSSVSRRDTSPKSYMWLLATDTISVPISFRKFTLSGLALNVNFFPGVAISLFVYVKHEIKRKKTEKEKQRKETILNKLDYFIHQVEIAKSLKDLYILHIKIWANGIRHENFGPDKYGMFRTNNILMMVPEEVYLGNIWGLLTKPLPFWETCSVDDQKLVIEQYQNILLSNMKTIKRDLEKALQEWSVWEDSSIYSLRVAYLKRWRILKK